MKDFSLLFKNAEKIKAQIEKSLGEVMVEGSAGGGMVRVKMNGNFDLIEVKVDPTVVDKEEIEMLEDLILAAVNDARRKAAEAARQAITRSIGFNLPSW
ncbi:YbaB/EbfC family nucleoid-associated protein [candidate division WOR-3 bacterium]|uniref:Nucleoid-associated protein DRP53_00300 n=1 Tax=candidate division WOR-3 bacterium TaxID=2052148 RepID=A0A660SMP3_UNCW3|nr:MAG: YbaB/EbfC family nucleoid-associated protein [candidate division WOR-3 bacterium]